MNNIEQLTQLLLEIIKDIGHFVNETFMTGFVSKIVLLIGGFLKTIASFLIVGLEAVIKFLEYFVK
ncbi:MAG: hypothetical protein PHG13_02620 [Candidatus Pacebacteria bacterium]|jgi:hypothetical protein|nr:hypothetical protein [Candidatus Paceibacterota bacterium]MDD3491828.1 hypothetical protein [Candidatus Paceibacterota bacterium]MDD5721708.1 hypothetical protein [Candidatus Paceibacterota bacterium]